MPPDGVRPPDDHPLHGAPYPHDRLHPRLYLAEAAGTALLIAAGLSVVVICFGSGSPLARWLPSAPGRRALAGTFFGLVGTLITISPIGRVSGAHINPAVSVAFALEGKLSWRDTIGYVLAQLLGALCGALALLGWGSMGRSLHYGATAPGLGVPVWLALAGEIFATFALVLVLFITSAHEQTRRYTPWTIPPLFAWLVWWEAPLSGASTNPARSLGPALLSGQWQAFWIYVVGPLLGAALAVGLLRLEVLGHHRVPVARLFRFLS
jgi:aquaporin Z